MKIITSIILLTSCFSIFADTTSMSQCITIYNERIDACNNSYKICNAKFPASTICEDIWGNCTQRANDLYSDCEDQVLNQDNNE